MAESPMFIMLRCQWGNETPCSRPATTIRAGTAPSGRFAVFTDDGAWHYPVCRRHVAPRRWGLAPAEVRKSPFGCWHAWIRGADGNRLGNIVCGQSREEAMHELADEVRREHGGRLP